MSDSPKHGDPGICASCGESIRYWDQNASSRNAKWVHDRVYTTHFAEQFGQHPDFCTETRATPTEASA